jgi:RHS repeat-associated protein
VVAITSPSGAVVATYAYGPYGVLTQVGGSDAALAARNPLRYRAYYHDTTTGHYYLPARYYDPDTMRFLSPDPAPPSAGDPLTLNRYAYCVGDPVDMSDPSGAVIDVDGDGRLGVQDSFTQAYISTPTVGHWKNTYRKAARRAGMISAVRNSLTTRMSALAVSNMARWEIRAAIAGTPADYTWCDQTSYRSNRVAAGPWTASWTHEQHTVNWETGSSLDSVAVSYGRFSWPMFAYGGSKGPTAPHRGIDVNWCSWDFFVVSSSANEGGTAGGTPSASLVEISVTVDADWFNKFNNHPLYGS